MEDTKLPEYLRSYFWDVDFDAMKIGESPMFVVKRVIDRGDSQALRWLNLHYSKDIIGKLLRESRDLSAKTATFWADFLGLNHSEVICLQKPYSRIPFGLSS